MACSRSACGSPSVRPSSAAGPSGTGPNSAGKREEAPVIPPQDRIARVSAPFARARRKGTENRGPCGPSRSARVVMFIGHCAGRGDGLGGGGIAGPEKRGEALPPPVLLAGQTYSRSFTQTLFHDLRLGTMVIQVTITAQETLERPVGWESIRVLGILAQDAEERRRRHGLLMVGALRQHYDKAQARLSGDPPLRDQASHRILRGRDQELYDGTDRRRGQAELSQPQAEGAAASRMKPALYRQGHPLPQPEAGGGNGVQRVRADRQRLGETADDPIGRQDGHIVGKESPGLTPQGPQDGRRLPCVGRRGDQDGLAVERNGGGVDQRVSAFDEGPAQ